MPRRSHTSMNSFRVHSPGTPPCSRDTVANARCSRSRSVLLKSAKAASFFLSSASLSARRRRMSSPGFARAAPAVPVTGSRCLLPSLGSARPRRTSPHLLVDHIAGRSVSCSGTMVAGRDWRLLTTGRTVQFLLDSGAEDLSPPEVPLEVDASAHPPDAASGGHRGRGQVGRLTSRGPTHGPARLLEGALLARARLHGRAPRRPFASCRWRRARARFHLARRTEADEHQPRGNDALEVRRALAMFDDARFVQTRRRVLVCDGPSARPPALVATAKK